MNNKAPIRTQITPGCSYYDEPIVETVRPRPELNSKLAYSLDAAFGMRIPRPVEVVTGYQMVQLRWMKPDGKGGLVPK